MPRVLPLILALALGACDGTEPDAPHALVGTWRLTDVTNVGYARSNAAVTFPDLSVAGTGDLVVDDGSDLSPIALRFVPRVDGLLPSPREITVQSFPPDSSLPAEPWAMLHISRSTYFGSSLSVGRGDIQLGQYVARSAPATDLTRSALVFPSTVYEGTTAAGEPVTATVHGTLRFTMRDLPAGVETEVPPWTDFFFEPAREHLVVFEETGAYRSEIRSSGRTTTRTGQWVAEDGTVRVTQAPLSASDPSETTEYVYRLEGGRLTLVTEPYPCAAECVETVERQLHLSPGTLASARGEVRYGYLRQGDPAGTQ